MTKPKVFISYSHQDEDWKNRLVTHLGVLQQQGLLDIWDDTEIVGGEDWYQKIQEAISTAGVAILLVSANFLNSKFILSEEVPRLLQRREMEGLHIFPVIAKPCAWKRVEWLTKMEIRPKGAHPLSGKKEHGIDLYLTSIAEEIFDIIEKQVEKLQKDCTTIDQNNITDDNQEIERAVPYELSTSFFSRRFGKAFPGVRGIEWFNSPPEAINRLSKLLEEPLLMLREHEGHRDYYEPIWWWRGLRDLSIRSFKQLDENKILIDYQEFDIHRIAAVNLRAYYQCFVYIETNPMEPTGLYPRTDEEIKESIEQFGYWWEEYGLFKGQYFVNRAEFDDGAAVINGELVDIDSDIELRIRYLTPYNLVIAPVNSPINHPFFETKFEEIMNNMLSGKSSIEELAEEVLRLPKHYFPMLT